jgi:hypothetical protein
MRPATSTTSLRLVRPLTRDAISVACAWCGIIARMNCTSSGE